jgi:lipoprotein NlpD
MKTINEQRMVMESNWKTVTTLAALLVALLASAGCTSTPNRAPVEDRGASTRMAVPTNGAAAAAGTADAAKALPGAENSGKPGYYTVKPGDTLIRIGLDNGQNWKDLVKWNGLDKPNLIEVGQVLRVVAPGVDPSAASTRPVGTAKVETRPLDAKGAAVSASAPPASGASGPVAAAASTAPVPVAPVASGVAREGDDDVNWAWPSAGAVIAPFDEAKVKGLVMGGKAGDPVLAAADGRVVYAGSGLRGYGNLIILKHNNTYLTAYAHNQTLLVKEEQAVRRGQKIAEMGSTDADGVRLHFEIRRQGKPIDPAKLLPPR